MRRLIAGMCWLILGAGFAPAFAQPAEEAYQKLQGTWTATQAQRDGRAAADGKPLYSGTVRVDPSAQPAAIDFEHKAGALEGKAWKGIYALEGDMLTICDNAPNLGKGRPAAFAAKSGSGYVLIAFKLAKR
jgi:hypothetical protein